uniref:Magnesium transporter n=1 Tax=Tetradesmus obliquus TaxID=3088 RepID=A0A383WIT7_TETOB
MQIGYSGPGPGLLGSSWQRRVHHPLQCRPCPVAPRQLCIPKSVGPRSGGNSINWASWALSSLLLGRISTAGASAEQQHSQQQHRQRSAATSNHNVASVDSQPGPAALVGASAKQLLQTAVHSLDMFEPRESYTLESLQTVDEQGMDSLEEMGQTGTLATAHIVKANYEVLRLDEAGAVRRLRIKRRDLLREHGLQPRDLRRIDPTIDFTKTSPSITIKEDVLLLNLGGIRAIVTADKALLFEPASGNTRKLLDTLVPRLQASAGQRLLAKQQAAAAAAAGSQGSRDGHESELYRREAYPTNWQARQAGARAPPFELEVLEGVLMVATGRLDAEVLSVTRRVGELLQKLPRDINPVNLEELRRIKQTLVELENKADTLREMLEQIMDDEDELRELNLSSRPRREERRKQRERDRMERQLTRAREEMEQTRRNSSLDDEQRRNSSSSSGDGGGGSNGSSSSSSSGMQPGSPGGGSSSSSRGSSSSSSSSWPSGPGVQRGPGSLPWPLLAGPYQTAAGRYSPSSSPPGTPGRSSPSSSSSSSSRLLGPHAFAGPATTAAEANATARRERLAELYAKHGLRRGPGGMIVPPPGGRDKQQREDDQRWREEGRFESRERDRDRDRDREGTGDPEDDFQDAQDALEELAEQEEEEEELEEVEDLLEYYLQRASATQSEAERLLEGARDLEESIGVSLSARRYEVNRLELMLSMGSFAAALGAMIAGIFGMNMRSTLEASFWGFWGVTGAIIIGCGYVFVAIMRYTQKKRIL